MSGSSSAVLERTAAHLAARGVRLPTFAELARPGAAEAARSPALTAVDPDAADPRNLFRVHWYNGPDRRELAGRPAVLVAPPELTGVEAPIALMLGDRFPLIAAHKVLAAYACLVPRLVTGTFDPTRQRALWPSTGNYCRGGVAISRILGCRGVAILPEGMSRERFEWLERWVEDPADVICTPGTESNVKEIYDRCDELAADPDHVVFNQFAEFGNHLAHWRCTGAAAAHAFESLREDRPGLRLAAFVSATGSAGTIGAGDHLAERYGARIVAAEALECPTLLYNGYGEHNIQGIGDKHVPLIHNVTNTDIVVAISDRHTDALDVLFQHPDGREYLIRERGVAADLAAELEHLGLSSICNLLAAIQVARRLRLGADDLILTVATDGADLYPSERALTLARRFEGSFDRRRAAAVFEESVLGQEDEHLLELSEVDRQRIFNLGYFTWVEQRGVSLADFERRRSQDFWRGLRRELDEWDAAITDFNERTGVPLA